MKFYFLVGFFFVFILGIIAMAENTDKYVEYERDRTLAEQKLRKEQRQKSPFDEA